MKRYVALLLSGVVAACGGGGDGGSPGPSNPSNPGGGGSSFTLPLVAGPRIEESNAAVSLSGTWTNRDPRWGWSGGAAVQSDVPGSKATLTFTGVSVRWIGARGRGMGKALVSVDGGAAKEVDLFSGTGDVVRTPIVTLHDLSDGPHTLTVEVVSGLVVVDAFDVQPNTTVSHWQDTDPNATFSADWTKASTTLPWSGNGASNPPELPVTAQETHTTDAIATLPFRGTGISLVGYKGPDGGIAEVQIDGGTPVEVDTYSATEKFQEVVFTATGLSDASHTLTIKATGRRNVASSAPRIVVDAFDVVTPARRFEQDHPSVTYHDAMWDRNNTSRVFSEGSAVKGHQAGASLTFSFVGTSVTWIGSRSSNSGTAKVYLDGALVQEINLNQSSPIEGYQMPVYRADGLARGPHTLKIEVTSTNGTYVVVDAFDVKP